MTRAKHRVSWCRRYLLLIVAVAVVAGSFFAGFALGRVTIPERAKTRSGSTESDPEASATYEPMVVRASDLLAQDPDDEGETGEVVGPETVTAYYDVPLSEELQDVMFSCCEQYGIEPALVLAVIEVESEFDPDAVSDTWDYGLMQVNKVNISSLETELGLEDIDLLDPETNIRCGCCMLNRFIQLADGDVVKGLMAYNMGYTSASWKWANGITSCDYSDKVMEAMEGYQV